VKILHTVEHYSPSVGGAQEVVRQLSERLAARGHEVTVATTRMPERMSRLLKGVAIEEFDVRGNAAHGIEGEAKRYQEFVRFGGFDVMLNYAAQQWATDLALPILPELRYGTVFAPCGFSGLSLPDYKDYFESLPELVAHYDRIVVHSDTYRDAHFLRSHGIDRTRVIPNGAASEEFEGVSAGDFRERHRIGRATPLLLSVGSHSGMKGHEAILEAFRRIKTTHAVLVLVGNVERMKGCGVACKRRARGIFVGSFGRKRVLLLDPPREQLLPAYAAADLFVLGSRIECSPLVLFEAAASRTPFVSVPAGNAEEIAAWTGGGVIVAASTDERGFVDVDPDELARAIDVLLEDPERREALAAAGRRAWEARFRWDTIVERYEELYAEVAAERAARIAHSAR
jgi:glycosyltransferase involved in cell wall biosynthesis